MKRRWLSETAKSSWKSWCLSRWNEVCWAASRVERVKPKKKIKMLPTYFCDFPTISIKMGKLCSSWGNFKIFLCCLCDIKVYSCFTSQTTIITDFSIFHSLQTIVSIAQQTNNLYSCLGDIFSHFHTQLSCVWCFWI